MQHLFRDVTVHTHFAFNIDVHTDRKSSQRHGYRDETSCLTLEIRCIACAAEVSPPKIRTIFHSFPYGTTAALLQCYLARHLLVPFILVPSF